MQCNQRITCKHENEFFAHVPAHPFSAILKNWLNRILKCSPNVASCIVQHFKFVCVSFFWFFLYFHSYFAAFFFSFLCQLKYSITSRLRWISFLAVHKWRQQQRKERKKMKSKYFFFLFLFLQNRSIAHRWWRSVNCTNNHLKQKIYFFFLLCVRAFWAK